MRTTGVMVISIVFSMSAGMARAADTFDLAPVEEYSSSDFEKSLLSDKNPSKAEAPVVSVKQRKDIVLKTISENYEGLQVCYKQGLKKDPNMKGKVEMGWQLDTEGRVSGVEVQSSQLKNKEVEKCMADQMSSWRFPSQVKLKTKSKDRMSYTFQFIPQE